jgi:hypothetical protein
MAAGLAVIHTAQRVLSAGTSSSNKKQPSKNQQQQQSWLPILPAARAALPVVLVHSEGVDRTAHLLLREYEDWQAQQPAAAAAAGRKQQKGTKQASAAAAAAGPGSLLASDVPPLLQLPVLNCFFAAAVDVSRAIKVNDEDAAAAAAAAAIKVAEVVFARQLLQVNAGFSSGAGNQQQQQQGLAPEAQTYALLAELYGASGQYKTVTSIVMAAIQHQLPLAGVPSRSGSSSSSDKSDVLQTVLAGAAAAWLSAGCAAVVACLLKGLAAAGVRQLSHPGLAAAVLAAADDEFEVSKALGKIAPLTVEASRKVPRHALGASCT